MEYEAKLNEKEIREAIKEYLEKRGKNVEEVKLLVRENFIGPMETPSGHTVSATAKIQE